MTSTYHPGLHRFALVLAASTFLLLIAGALVTSNDAALSVPDWPLSYGSLTPPMVGGIRYEHTHRVVAAAVGLLTVVMAVLLWRKEVRPWVRWFGAAAVLAVCLQGLLGGMTVLLKLHYGFPVEHASLAQLFFGCVVAIAFFTSRWWVSSQPALQDRLAPSVYTVALLNSAVIFLQVVLGAGFRHKNIPIWPHLLGAVAVTGSVMWTGIVLRRRFGAVREFTRARIVLHSVFGTQILLGGGALWARLASSNAPQPVPATVAVTVIHTVVGALTFASAVSIVLLCYRLIPRRATAQVPVSHPEAATP
jgi:cytochrome c oxidase assembly protein subunit 15